MRTGHCKWCGMMLDASLDNTIDSHLDLRTCVHVMSLTLASVQATAIRRRSVLGTVEWTGRLYADDLGYVQRCPECGGRKPEHDKSCRLNAEIRSEP